jgi:hypothetical protein
MSSSSPAFTMHNGNASQSSALDATQLRAGLRATYRQLVQISIAVIIILDAIVYLVADDWSACVGIAALGAAFSAWVITTVGAAQKGQIAGVGDADLLLAELSQPNADTYGAEKKVCDIRKKGLRAAVICSLLFGLLLFTPLLPLTFLFMGLPLYLGQKYRFLVKRMSAVAPDMVDRTGRAMKYDAGEQIRSTAEPLRAAAQQGAGRAANVLKNAAQKAPVQPPLRLYVDVDRGILEVGSCRFRIDDILEATMLQKQASGVAFEIASIAGITALGPFGALLARVARRSGIGDRIKLGLKLTMNDERAPIKIIDVTPDPLPVSSPLCNQTRATLERVLAQLRVIRVRRTSARQSTDNET